MSNGTFPNGPSAARRHSKVNATTSSNPNPGIQPTYCRGKGSMNYRSISRGQADTNKPVKVFDFFCGCGGASSGFRSSGMNVALGLDNDPDAERSFRLNFPDATFFGDDIADVPESALDATVDACKDHPLLFNACAPCQPFSRQRRSNSTSDDGRTRLLDHVLRFVGRYRPELVFSENVPGLRDDSCGREIFERLVATLQQMGYATTHNVIRSQEYGVPQHRARLVLLASVFGPVSFASRTHGADTPHTRLSTVGEWISALPAIAAGEAHPSVPNHRAAKLSSLNMQRIRSTPPGGGWQDLPSELRPRSRRSGFGGFTDVYGRLRWDAPAPALTTRCISFSNGRFGHPFQDRAISVREAACLQTLPLGFVLTGSLNSQARQVGNAVPALLAQRFGECFANHLADIDDEAGSVTVPPRLHLDSTRNRRNGLHA